MSRPGKIRLVARLDVKDENLVKGIQYEGLRKLGDPHDFAVCYYKQSIDELLYLDTVASLYERNNLGEILRHATQDVFIPITAGGGLRSVEDVGAVLKAGADKAAINTAVLRCPQLITEVARAFGSQCMVLSVQAKRRDPSNPDAGWEAYYDNGREHSGMDVLEWVRRGVELGAGEILLSSVDCEGVQKGMDQSLIAAVSALVDVPVINFRMTDDKIYYSPFETREFGSGTIYCSADLFCCNLDGSDPQVVYSNPSLDYTETFTVIDNKIYGWFSAPGSVSSYWGVIDMETKEVIQGERVEIG